MTKSSPSKILNSEMSIPGLEIKALPIAKAKTLSEARTSAIVIVTTEARVKSLQALNLLPDSLKKRAKDALSRRFDELKAGGLHSVEGVDSSTSDLSVAVLPKDLSAFSLLTFGKKIMKSCLNENQTEMVFIFDGLKNENLFADCLGSAVAARIFRMPVVGKRIEDAKEFKLKQIQLMAGKSAGKFFEEGFHKGNGTNIVRFLGMLPPNYLDTAEYGVRIKKICQKLGFDFKFYSNKELKKMGAGAFTAVDQGDPESSGGIYELTYNPRGAKNKNPVALVGKGLCFDTGGYDIKTGGYMVTMKGDMQGSAVALSTMMTAAALKLPLKLKTFLGVTANHLSPKSYTADEVVVAMNGISIEVINTDAEGRMVLADTLCLAERSKPEMIVDFATLTGSAVRSLGTSYAAGFTNEEKLHSGILKAGRESGERVWTFPLDEDYGKPLESAIADTLQCTKGPGPDHIYAATFLKKFVGETSWVHIDLSAAEKDGGLAHTDTMFTGFGVRWAVEFLRSQFKV